MARPKRSGDWVPVTARVDAETARRLRVAAAKRGTTMGRIMDELVLAHLPPIEDPTPTRAKTPSRPATYTIERLKADMDRLGINQSALGRALGVTARAISEWFERGQVPAQRQQAIAKALAELRKKP